LGGAEVPIVEADGTTPAAPGTLFVGPGKAAGALYQAAEFEPLGPDGFILRAKGGMLVAAGKNHRGTVYAVYRLLERLGCRFYARELEVVPTTAGVTISAPLDVVDSAGFEWRAMLGTIPTMKCSLSPGEWEASVAGVDVPKMMAFPKGGFWHHTMGFLLPAKPLAETHPEYLALVGKDRKVDEPAVQQYCLSNPELLQAMTGKVLDWIASDPDKLYYPVHYGDVVKFCECDKCKAMYEEKGSVTDTVIWFDNQIAKVVGEKYPGKFVTILAYHSTRTPPKNVKPEPNLLIIFCAIVECQARPWSHPVNMKLNVCKDLEEWIRLHPLGPKGIMTFDYPTTYHYAGYTYPALYAFVDNIRYYHKLGLRGVYVCGLGSWKHLEHVYSYVIPRIMWQPDQDMGALIDEFCNAWYGSAAKPMRDYVELLHRSAMESPCEGVADCHKGPGQKFFRDLYTPEFVAKAYALFAQAEAQATDPLVRNRIAKDKWGFLVTDLFLNGTKSGEILPASNAVGFESKLPTLEEYRKVSELLRINRLFNRPWLVNSHQWNRFSLGSLVGFEPEREPWWTSPRVQELMASPDAAFRKAQDMDREKQQRFVTLENDDLQVIVVPTLGGRIWRLYHKGLKSELLRRAALPIGGLERGLPSTPYVGLSGYEEYTAKKFGSAGWGQAFQSQLAADGNAITLTATFPNGLKLTRVVALAPDKPELTIDSRLENAGAQPVKDAVLRVHPEFLPQAGDEKPELQTRTTDGKWKTIPYEAGDNFLVGDKRPQGAWALRFPKAGLRIADELDSAQIDTWYFYNGNTFFNLELFSPARDLAPGESIGLKHRYVVSRGE